MSSSLAIPELLETKQMLFEKYFADFLSHPCIAGVQRLVLTSEYACRHIQLIKDLLMEDDLKTSLSKADYLLKIQDISLEESQVRFSDLIRSFRHRHFLRNYLQEMSALTETADTLQSWSDCADALITHSLDYCHRQLASVYGQPCDEHGEISRLLVLGMGKLGGRELNFSSDIDLIFAFTSNGQTNGSESLPNQVFFSKVVQMFVKLMQLVTVNGFVFRVDLRLRPNGDSGTLVFSLAAMETYYQEQGRDWERYAMVKARVIHPMDETIHHTVEQLIKPFVYRRYVDFSVIESLRSMKAMIEREVKLDPYLNDIKRGQGGIREVEFIIQNIQLIRGGRIPRLQEQNALKALAVLKQEGLLDRTEALKQAYLFLRKLENALQALNDQQTHALPQDDLKKIQMAYAMNYVEWLPFYQRLQQYQRIISLAFQSVLKKVEEYEDEKRLLMNQLANVWHGHVESRMAINLLASLGYKKSEHCYQMIHAFRHGARCRRLTQAARMRLDRFMVLLLVELCECEETDKVLLQVMHLLENIVGRSAYLALLTENPSALKELLFWFAHSSFISDLLVSQPFLLEVLLDYDPHWKPSSGKQLARDLRAQLFYCKDKELQEDILRQFKLTQWLLAARAALYKQCDAVRINRFLSEVAEVIVKELFELACLQLSDKYPDIDSVKNSFFIVAYGKSGSREMNFTSDLDLVFLHRAKPSQEHLITRLTQKILHMLTTRSQAGVLYTVDTRLRPSGSSGLLISHFDAFKEYQLKNAWTWEHQALLKTRVIIGNKGIKHSFITLKQDIFSRLRLHDELRREVLEMRAKINKYQSKNQIKYGAGGLLDLEFLIQFLALLTANPAFSSMTHPLKQLAFLYQQQIISLGQFKLLKKAYKTFHQCFHQQLLQQASSTAEQLRLNVRTVCEALYKM